MKSAPFLVTVLVCTSMTEAFSAKWAKNQVKAIQIYHFETAVAQGIHFIQIFKEVFNWYYFSARTVHNDDDGTGCGYTCNLEAKVGYQACLPFMFLHHGLETFLACWSSFFDSDCHDCLCDWIYDNTGYSCPSP